MEQTKAIYNVSPEILATEERIVWIDHPENFSRYIRESVIFHSRRRTRPRSPGRLVAYAILKRETQSSWPGHSFMRRVWWLKEYDPYEGGGCPCEAVDPLRIRAGQFSYYPVDQVRVSDD